MSAGHKLVIKPHSDDSVDLVCLDPEHDWFRAFDEPPTLRDIQAAEFDHLEDVRLAMPGGIYASDQQRLGPFPLLYALQSIPDAVQGFSGRPAPVRQWWKSAGWSQCSEPRPEQMHLIGPIPEGL